MSFQCKKCGTTVILPNDAPRAETLFILCPNCGNTIEASSCYGFGPVWPACIYKGNQLLAEFNKVGEYRDNNFELKVFGKKTDFKLPSDLREDNYKSHFEICHLIIKRLQEQHIL